MSVNRPIDRTPVASRKELLKSESLSPNAVSRNMKELGVVPFSDSLIKDLREPRISTKTFQKAVAEAASFYYHHMPKIRGYHSAYNDTMEKIVKKFPSLEAEGVKPWVSTWIIVIIYVSGWGPF